MAPPLKYIHFSAEQNNICGTKTKFFESASTCAFSCVLENQNTRFSPPAEILNIAQFWPPHFENQCAGPVHINQNTTKISLFLKSDYIYFFIFQ